MAYSTFFIRPPASTAGRMTITDHGWCSSRGTCRSTLCASFSRPFSASLPQTVPTAQRSSTIPLSPSAVDNSASPSPADLRAEPVKLILTGNRSRPLMKKGRRGGSVMERLWLRSYPPGVPATIDLSRYASLVALFEESFTAFADRQSWVCMGKSLTYQELDEASRAFAAWLQSRGLKPGARVAIMMPNVLQYPVAITAVLRAGCVVVNVNPLYKPRELEFQLTDSGAEAIIVLENFASMLEQALQNTQVKHVVVASLGDMLGRVKGTVVNAVVRYLKRMVPAYAMPSAAKFNDVLTAGRKSGFNPVQIDASDVAFLQYTGGTTGLVKGAMLTHRNLVANMLQVEAWNQPMVDLPPK